MKSRKINYRIVLGIFVNILIGSDILSGLEVQEFPDAPLHLQSQNAIVISAMRNASRKSDSTAPVEVLTKDDIRARGARNLADVLNNENGYTITRGFAGSNLQFQGLDATYLLILKDGERLNGRVNNVIDLSRFSTETIERIEIIRGSASSLYGADAIGGVINIITRPEGKTTLEANTSAGTLNDYEGNAVLQSSLGNLIYKVGGGYRTQAPFKRDTNSAATTGRGFDDANILASLEYRINSFWSASVQSDYQQRRLYGVDTGAGNAVFDRTNLTETSQSIVSLRRFVADDSEFKISGNVSLFRDQFLYDQRNDTSLDDYQDTREVSGQVNAFYSTQFFSNQRVTLGTEAFQESLTTPRVGSDNRLRRRYAGYAQNDISIQKFIVSPSARFDHDTQFGNFTSPRLGLKWAQDNELIVRASGGYGFRSPSFRELYLFFENPGAGYTINGNPNLRPEISRTANAGVEWNPLDKLSIDVNTFYNDLSDLIQTATVPGSGAATRFEFRNIARAYTTGADIRVSLAPVRFWRFDVGYSFLEARDVSAGRFLEGRSRHRVNAAINFNTRTFQFFVRSVLTGERPFYADEVTRVANLAAPFVSVDAKAEWFVLKNISIYLGGDNLTNAGDATLNPLQPMRIYAGLRYQG